MNRNNAGYASQAHFAKVPSANIRRSKFRRPMKYKTTLNAGDLIPFYIDEVLPGDTFEFNSQIFGRLTTPVVPIMDDIFLDTQFFFVPNRLIWENWERFNGAQDNPGDSTDYLTPVVNTPEGGWQVGSLSDYFGLPVNQNISPVCAFWHRAYNLIWNEWYRDENLQDSVEVPIGDGPDLPDTFKILKRGKRKDYYTSAQPQPQKGPGIELPLSGVAPVITGDADTLVNSSSEPLRWKSISSGDFYSPSNAVGLGTSTSGRTIAVSGITGTSTSLAPGNLVADMSSGVAATINSFRMAFQLQMLLERDNLGGTRYFEILTAHFGVRSPDSRLQRPEFLGGSSMMMDIEPVAQTASTDSTSPQGNLAAYGVFGGKQPKWTKSFVEHGVIIGLISVRSNLTYQQGVHRMFSRSTRWDFYWPALAHLGEQAILNKEIYADGSENDDKVFGYQERWSEYRYGASKVTGKLRSNIEGSLDVWHLAQDFENLPTLSPEFIVDNPPMERVLAVQNEPQILLDVFVDLYCTRPMPTYSVPGLVTHF